MVDQSPKTNNIQSPLSLVNGAISGSQMKVEQSPAISFQEPPNPNIVKHRNSFPQPMFMHSQIMPHGQPQSPLTHQQSWPATYNLLPQPQAQGQVTGQASNLTSPIYPTFSQATLGGISTAGTYASIPTSLASLLHPSTTSDNIYMSYQSQQQSQHVGSVGINGDPPMTFSPSHYYDGPGPLTWPLISMPPGQQS